MKKRTVPKTKITTVKARICVIVQSDGHYAAVGETVRGKKGSAESIPDIHIVRHCADMLYDNCNVSRHVVWLEVEVPLPKEVEAKAKIVQTETMP